jgi:hypothetical protein
MIFDIEEKIVDGKEIVIVTMPPWESLGFKGREKFLESIKGAKSYFKSITLVC